MKRTSVHYTVTSEYSHNPNTRENTQIRRNSTLVLVIGILLLTGILFFIFKHLEAGILLSAIVPGNPFGESQKDDDGKNILLSIVGIIVLALLPFTVF